MVSTSDPIAYFAGISLAHTLARNWWRLLLRGIFAVLFGILAIVWPGITLLALTLLWGAFMFADGVFALWTAVAGKAGGRTPRWWLAVAGVAGLVAGLLTFFWPGITLLVLLMFVAAWAIVVGALQIWGAIRLRREIADEWLLGLSGLLSLLFGILVVFWPVAGAVGVAWLIGWFAILIGANYIALSFRLKKHRP